MAVRAAASVFRVSIFIDARKMGHMVDRTRRELSDEDIAKIARTYHAWRGEPGFCRAVPIRGGEDSVESHGFAVPPGRYAGAAEAEDTPFPERFAVLRNTLEERFAEGERLTAAIRQRLAGVVVNG